MLSTKKLKKIISCRAYKPYMYINTKWRGGCGRHRGRRNVVLVTVTTQRNHFVQILLQNTNTHKFLKICSLTLGKGGRAERGGVPLGGSNMSERSLAEPGEKGESRSMSTGESIPPPAPGLDRTEQIY
jgi:hypothetical protein